MNENDLLETVCRIEDRKGGHVRSGNGVFISPWHVLTSWHILHGMSSPRFIGKFGSANMLKGSPYNKRSSKYDLALVALDKPVGDAFANVNNSNEPPCSVRGLLATKFNREAKTYGITLPYFYGYREIRAMNEKVDLVEYTCEIQLRPGYSGSPVFDDKGRVISLVSAGNANDLSQDAPRGEKRFLAPAPKHLAQFYSQHFLGRTP